MFGDAGNCIANRIITFLKEFYKKNTRWNPTARFGRDDRARNQPARLSEPVFGRPSPILMTVRTIEEIEIGKTAEGK